MGADLTLGPDDYPKLVQAIQAAGSLEKLLELAYESHTARTRPSYRHAGDVLAAVELKVLTRAEARRLLGHRTPRKQ